MRAATSASRASGKAAAVGRCGTSFKAANAAGRATGPVLEGKGRRPARYCVKLLVNSAAIAIVAFLVSLGRRPLRGHTPL